MQAVRNSDICFSYRRFFGEFLDELRLATPSEKETACAINFTKLTCGNITRGIDNRVASRFCSVGTCVSLGNKCERILIIARFARSRRRHEKSGQRERNIVSGETTL